MRFPYFRLTITLAASFASIMACGNAMAQELAPRAYWPMPTGSNVLVVGYQNTSGDVLTDASLPLTGVESDVEHLQVAYQRAFGLFGRTTTVQLSLPYSSAKAEGLVAGEFYNRDVSGRADSRLRFAINLKGAPSMDAAGFQALVSDPKLIIGTSLIIQPPDGDYEADKVINLGTNRWSAKPAVGMIWPLQPTLLLEMEVGVWLYGDNDNFLGERREQDPLISSEFHLIKQLRRGLWMSLDANYYAGGETRVGDDEEIGLQRNSRVGVTVSSPIRGGHAIRASFSTPIFTELGGEFDNFTLSYFYAW